ncbi:hypothetical protein V8E52_010943 [Russula decolorans]
MPSSVLTSSSLSSCDQMEDAWAPTSFSWTCMVSNAPYKHIRATSRCRWAGGRRVSFIGTAQAQSALTSGLPEPTLVTVGETTVISDNRLIGLRPHRNSSLPLPPSMPRRGAAQSAVPTSESFRRPRLLRYASWPFSGSVTVVQSSAVITCQECASKRARCVANAPTCQHWTPPSMPLSSSTLPTPSKSKPSMPILLPIRTRIPIPNRQFSKSLVVV